MTETQSFSDKFWQTYRTQYKKLLIIPFLLIIISLIGIGTHLASTGDIISKDVSLKGGVMITVPLSSPVALDALEQTLQSQYPENDIAVRSFGSIGVDSGVIVEADLDANNNEEVDSFLASLAQALDEDLDSIDYGLEFFGSSLGESFFKESAFILLIAFFFMALVIFIYFRLLVPSIAIVAAAFFDMLAALAFVNIFEIKLGTAGIAAFLMLIGYAVDTNILLSVRVLKQKDQPLEDRFRASVLTGLTQTGTSLVAIVIALFITQSEIIRQIMLILFVGLIADIIFTWIQNVGLLRYYFERKEKHHG